jgi:hypothetical protein
MKMKNLLFILISILVIVLGCEKEEERAVVGTFTAPALSTPSTVTWILTEAEEDCTLVTFHWTAADFGFLAATNYTVQIDFASNNFSTPATLGITNKLELTISVGDLNNKLIIAGAIADLAQDFSVRISAVVHEDVDTLYSPAVAVHITPFEKIVEYAKLYVPGSYQNEWNPDWPEWDVTNLNTCVYSVKDNGKYEGYLYFNEATTYFKFTKVQAWEQTNTLGDADAGGQSGTLLLNDWGNNIMVTTGAGYYLVKADINAATYSTTLTDWGLIGSATPGGWDSDQNMAYDPVNDVWTITLDLVAGDIKFRANDDWVINYGDDTGAGKLSQDAANIPIGAAGNYTITLDLSGAIYRYSVENN